MQGPGVYYSDSVGYGGTITGVSITNPGTGYDPNTIMPTSPPYAPPTVKIFAGIGSRKTPPEICSEMTRFASMMAAKGWILRSGAADGADMAFEKGYEEYPNQKEIYLPWKNFNNNSSLRYKITQEAIDVASRFHPAWKSVTKNDASVKLLARNSYQILGEDLQTPCNLVVCWTEGGKEDGGTGQAMRIAGAYGIKIMNLADFKIK